MTDTQNTADTPNPQDPQQAKLAELIEGIRFAMLTTVDPDGTLVSRPMAAQDSQFDGTLWFIANRESRKATHLAGNPHVNVTLSSTDKWVSLDGTGHVVTDQAKVDELWNPGIEAWFPNGRDDPSIVLIRIDADSAEYWDSPGGRVATVLSLAKAKLTGKPYSGGENEKVEL